MSPRTVTPAEAQEMLDGRESKGAWDAGAESVYAGHNTCPRHRGDAANERIRCECRSIARVDLDGDRALMAAAPDLAATVAAEPARIAAAVAAERAAIVAWLRGEAESADRAAVASCMAQDVSDNEAAAMALRCAADALAAGRTP